MSVQKTSTRVSVFVPTYNSQECIGECLECMVNQTHPLYEIVVCDDASTDNTRDVILDFARRYPNTIKPILQEQNIGISRNFNAGLQAVEGEYTSLCAGDDFWELDKIEQELRVLDQHPDARWVYSDSAIFFHHTGKTKPFRRKFDGAAGEILFEVMTRQMSLRNWLAQTSLVREVGCFDESLKCYEDWDYKIRLAEQAIVAHCPKQSVYYRQRKTETASTNRTRNQPSKAMVQQKHRRLLERFTDSQRDYLESVWEQDMYTPSPPVQLFNRVVRKLRTVFAGNN